MASPLAHTIIAYAVHDSIDRSLSDKLLGPGYENHNTNKNILSLLRSIFLANLPDLDAVIGILFKDMRRYHNNITHSIFTCLTVSLLSVGIPGLSAFHTFVHYTLHLLTDLLSHNKRGLMLFAPFSSRRYRLPITLFYGFRWGRGLFSSSHLWTLATELLFTLFVLRALKVFRKVRSVE